MPEGAWPNESVPIRDTLALAGCACRAVARPARCATAIETTKRRFITTCVLPAAIGLDESLRLGRRLRDGYPEVGDEVVSVAAELIALFLLLLLRAALRVVDLRAMTTSLTTDGSGSSASI